MKVFEVFGTVEGDGRNVAVGLVLLDKLQLHVSVLGAYQTAVAVVVDIFRYEYGRQVAGPNGWNCFRILKNLGVICLKSR